MISFKGKQYLRKIILMAIRWYIAYPLSYRDIEELLKERGLHIDHATINRWVIEYSPQLLESFKKTRKSLKLSWRMDETYVKVKGKLMYQYRAVDNTGNTVDCYFSVQRNKKAAKNFFAKALQSTRRPVLINIDKSGSNYAALKSINNNYQKNRQIKVRQCKYLNNIVEQDHRFIKKIIRMTLGFKAIDSATATLEGIELHHMLRKGQHVNSNLTIFKQFYGLAA